MGTCSLCGREAAVADGVGGRTGSACCQECALEALAAMPAMGPAPAAQLPTPAQLCRQLDEYVVAQGGAKRVIANAVYGHYRRLERRDRSDPGTDVEIEKSNVLLVGPTGVGKTLIAKVLARILSVPFATYDTTSLTQAGFVGEDVENVLLRLLQDASWDIDRASRGIVYLDEIDKLARRSTGPSITRDPSGEGVQQALLKIIEGTEANVPRSGGRKHPEKDMISLPTHDILFICGGMFEGIDKIHARRSRGNDIGFVRDQRRVGAAAVETVTPEDLVEFGMLPEFIGRLPVIASLDPLGESDLLEIMERPRNALLKQFAARAALDDGIIEMSDEAKREIARRALRRGSGARGLRAVIELLMRDPLFELPEMPAGTRIVVDAGAARGEHPVRLVTPPQAQERSAAA